MTWGVWLGGDETSNYGRKFCLVLCRPPSPLLSIKPLVSKTDFASDSDESVSFSSKRPIEFTDQSVLVGRA